MSEPKKETVRIVLPPRRDGQPLASTPRETAMINLPPKPVPAAPAPAAPAAPVPPPMAAPKPPTSLTPPAAPGIPKPPTFPGAPKPPGAAPAAPAAPSVPKPSVAGPAVPPPTAPKPPTISPAPAPTIASKPVTAGPIPVSVKPEAKKETAKVTVPAAVVPKPQATVRLQPRPQPSQAASFKVQTVEPVSETTEEEIPMNLAIVAVATAVIAFAIQVWMMM